MGLKTPQVIVDKRKHTHSTPFVKTGTYSIRLQKSRTYLPKTARTFGILCGKQVSFVQFPSHSVGIGSTLGDKHYLIILSLPSQIYVYLREKKL